MTKGLDVCKGGLRVLLCTGNCEIMRFVAVGNTREGVFCALCRLNVWASNAQIYSFTKTFGIRVFCI